jgi:hypothetical protein
MKSALPLRFIDPAPFKAMLGGMGDCEPGPAPQLQWIAIGDLVVDTRYQRDLGKTGGKNIVRIAREFEWAKFAPVVVAPIEGGQWAIVDGQHRTTAAALRGITKVPCQVIIADQRKQAAAFAAINANVTEMSPMQVPRSNGPMRAGRRSARATRKPARSAGTASTRRRAASTATPKA